MKLLSTTRSVKALIETQPLNPAAELEASMKTLNELRRRLRGFQAVAKQLIGIVRKESIRDTQDLQGPMYYLPPDAHRFLVDGSGYPEFAVFMIMKRNKIDAYQSLEHLLERNRFDFKSFWESVGTLLKPSYSRSTSRLDDMQEWVEEEFPTEVGRIRGLFQKYREGLGALQEYAKVYAKTHKDITSILRGFKRDIERYYKTKGTSEQVTVPTEYDVRYAPEHKGVEVLYHASPVASLIVKEGFKTRKELGGEAALGGGPEDLISFTSDPKVAKEIARALREVISIANGEVSLEEVLRKVKKAGVDLTKWGVWTDYEEFKKGRSGQTSEQVAFQIWRSFLAASERYDPVFFGVSAETFKGKKPQDVGVVAAEVDMSEAQQYLEAMSEWRVPSTAVKRVVGLLRS